MRRRMLLLILAAGCAGSAQAAPTGLNTIPTADLIPVHQWTFTLQNGNASVAESPTLFQQPQPLYQLQFGLTPQLEGGLDFAPANPPHDYRPQFNLKWKPLPEAYDRPAVAAGVATLGPGFEPSAYLVVTRTINFDQVQYNKFKAHRRNIKLRGRRVHAGLIHTADGTFPMLGADWELSDRVVLYSDWISGRANAVTLGGVYALNASSSITASMLIGNQAGHPNGMLVNFSRTRKW